MTWKTPALFPVLNVAQTSPPAANLGGIHGPASATGTLGTVPNVSTPDRPAFIIGKVILSDDSPTWWPTSNTGQHFPNVAKDQFLEIKEFSQTYAMLEREPYRLGGHIEMRRHSPSGLCRFRQAVNDLS